MYHIVRIGPRKQRMLVRLRKNRQTPHHFSNDIFAARRVGESDADLAIAQDRAS
jgi:hypothetical protein